MSLHVLQRRARCLILFHKGLHPRQQTAKAKAKIAVSLQHNLLSGTATQF